TTIPVGADGETVIEAKSRDAAGNESAARKVTVRIDSKAPSVTIATPAEGAQVPIGSGAKADFACADAGSGIASCVGTVADGAAIDKGAVGKRALTVTAIDKLGKLTVVTRRYRVVAGKPRLSKRPVSAKLGKLNRKGVAKLVLRNREAFAVKGKVTVLAKTGAKTLAKSVRFSLARQAKRTFKVKFGKATKRAVSRGKKVRARLRIAVTGPAGDKRTVKATVRLKRGKR
ncbi:MAG: hypothetical protein QOI80_3735, partial [Solirubrobacteraceae bacterium]|nr:hypothetical protein [Solirubrobacteraceae bacterium]